MPPFPTKTIRPMLDRLVARPHGMPDAEALSRFTRHKDEVAFAQLVERYGPFVMGVCRRLLGSRPEADDAMLASHPTQLAGHFLIDAQGIVSWVQIEAVDGPNSISLFPTAADIIAATGGLRH